VSDLPLPPRVIVQLAYALRRLVHDVAHRSIVTFDPTQSSIRNALLQIALAPNTNSGHAPLYALLAFSSLRRSGLSHTTMQFKLAALRALSASAARATQGPAEAAQHIATLMLLCAYEVSYR
jgi:hypothetical protein